MASNNVRGVSRILNKLENSVKAGDYYEAHQMYRTLYFRYLGQKKYDELLDMMYEGAQLFLNHDQQGSGADLSILLIDVLEKSENTDVNKWVPKLTNLFSKISHSVPERDTFLVNAIRWSKQDTELGHPLLHQIVAQVYWNEKNYVQARHHYLRSYDGDGCARLLIEFQCAQGYSYEVDLFIAQTVLQYLCLSNTSTATQTFTNYTQQHPGIRKQGPPYLFPILNFIWFLLQAIESRKLAAFTVLCEQYQPSIKRDPCYVQYLDKIGQIFFGVKPPQRQNGGFLGNFIQNFLGGLDDDSDDDIQPSLAPTAARASTSQPMESSELD